MIFFQPMARIRPRTFRLRRRPRHFTARLRCISGAPAISATVAAQPARRGRAVQRQAAVRCCCAWTWADRSRCLWSRRRRRTRKKFRMCRNGRTADEKETAGSILTFFQFHLHFGYNSLQHIVLQNYASLVVTNEIFRISVTMECLHHNMPQNYAALITINEILRSQLCMQHYMPHNNASRLEWMRYHNLRQRVMQNINLTMKKWRIMCRRMMNGVTV